MVGQLVGDERRVETSLSEGCYDAFLAIEGQNDFAVASRLKTVSVAVTLPDFLMVVDFAVHGKHLPAVRTEQWLSSGFRVDDG